MITVFAFWIPALWFTGTQGETSLWPLAVRDGDKVSLPCPVMCSIWSFTGLNGAAKQELINQLTIKGKVTSDRLSVCSLVIHKVTVENAGWYTCTVLDKTGRTPGSALSIHLTVVVITEQKYGGNVTLNCSVSTPTNCDQDSVKWIHNSMDVNRDSSYVKISQSLCSATVTIMNFTYSNISPYDFMCGVRMHTKVEVFAFSPHSSSEDTNSTTTSKNNTNTGITTIQSDMKDLTEKKPGDNNTSILTPENCEHAKVKWIHNSTVWCRLIIVVVSLAALIAVVVIINILTIAVPKAKMDGNMVYNEADDGAAKPENVQSSEEI
ncbi:protein quaking [Sarotherodon galilaeus]